MRQDNDIRVGVDVGSRAVRAVVLRPAKGAGTGAGEDGLLGPVEVLGAGVAESRGVALGEVVDARRASRAIREAVEEAERASGANVRWAVLGAAGGMVKTRGLDAEVELRAGRVEPWDPERARAMIRTLARTAGRQRLLEQFASFRVAGAAPEPVEVADPVGLQGARLLVSAVVLEADAISLAALAAAGRRAGVETRALGWSPLAAALAVLGERAREDGVAVLDLGAESAGLVLFAGGRLLYASGRRSGEDGDGLWRWLRDSLGGFLGSGILPRDLLPAGLVLSGGGGLRPDALSLAHAELGMTARAAALDRVQGLPGPAAEWAAAIGLARLLEATDALRRRTDRTREPAPISLHRPVSARLAALPGGAEAVLPRQREESELLETGIDCLDQFPGRPARGQLCLLASQPFSGASGMALQIALHSALHRLEPTLLVTGNQSFKRTALELAGIEAKLHPSEVLHTGKGRRSKAERLAAALTRIVDSPLWVLDAEEDGVDDAESLVGAARAIHASLGKAGGEGLGLRLVVVD
ncbi:MAG TPA: DnaB-like helicase C-terminal domain-containing protein, partial [Myxococcota bacterium]|nr:DnaB-like helicase C-terminal domain-containing protein [Myxococcota bacterium]